MDYYEKWEKWELIDEYKRIKQKIVKLDLIVNPTEEEFKLNWDYHHSLADISKVLKNNYNIKIEELEV